MGLLANELTTGGSALPCNWRATDTKRIVFVDDDTLYRQTLDGELTDRGFAVRSFPDATCFLAAADLARQADILLFDWTLPHMSGIELLEHLRQGGIPVPVAFLTGRALTAYENLAFDKGAVDFIDKARGLEVLVRRLTRLVANGKRAARGHAVQSFGQLSLRCHIARADWDGVDVGLTLGEFNVVHLLASSSGSIVSYRSIYDRMHYAGFVAGTGDDGYRTNVRSSIKRIRRKFAAVDAGFDEINNLTGSGYCWGVPTETS